MPKVNPSQYDCNNMKPGDIIYVIPRNLIYKIYRYLFKKDSIQISVRKDWIKEKPDYVQYYQEDCILFYNYENKCVQTNKNISYKYNRQVNKPAIYKKLDKLVITLYELQLFFESGEVISIHLDVINNSINKNNQLLKQLDRNEIIERNIHFQKYKGDTFKNLVIQNNIKTWEFNYCFLCGKPLVFHFDESKIYLENKCNCGNTSINIKEMTYDDFAIWFCSQTDSNILKIYKNFWFNKKE